MKQIELEEKLYGKAQMELVAKHRMREVATWSKLKKSLMMVTLIKLMLINIKHILIC